MNEHGDDIMMIMMVIVRLFRSLLVSYMKMKRRTKAPLFDSFG